MGEADPTGGQEARRAFTRLRRGDVVGALAAAGDVPAERRSPHLAMTVAEARVCFGRGDLDEIEHLRDLGAATGDDTLLLRAQAALADHHATRGDPLCGTIAAQALAAVSHQRITDTERLWARGRLWRILSLAMLFAPQNRPATSLELLDRARADFGRAGFDAESARAVADLHFVWLLVFAEDFDRACDVVAECLARLRQLDSSYVDLVLAYRVFLDQVIGDLPAAHAGAAEIDRIGATRPLHPLAGVIVSYVRVTSRLVGEGPTPAVLQAIDEHLSLVRAQALLVTAGQLVGMAALLIDLGHTDAAHVALARRWARQAAATGGGTPQTGHDVAGLLARLDLLDSDDDEAAAAAVAAIDANVTAARQMGLRRDAAHRALRAALLARRLGRHELADRLHAEGVADLPPPGRRGFWEHALLHMIGSAPGLRPAGPSAVTVRLLGPEVEVEVDGRRRPVGTAMARLVVALVAEGGAAPADRVVDLLWPDADAPTGRARLRVALHRLRQALRPDVQGAGRPVRRGHGADDPVQRRGDVVALGPGVRVDALELEKLASGGPTDRVAALTLYRGDVAHAQLAYDEVAAPLRRRLAAIWRRLARDAVQDPELGPPSLQRIAAVAAAGSPHDADLTELLHAAEARLRP